MANNFIIQVHFFTQDSKRKESFQVTDTAAPESFSSEVKHQSPAGSTHKADKIQFSCCNQTSAQDFEDHEHIAHDGKTPRNQSSHNFRIAQRHMERPMSMAQHEVRAPLYSSETPSTPAWNLDDHDSDTDQRKRQCGGESTVKRSSETIETYLSRSTESEPWSEPTSGPLRRTSTKTFATVVEQPYTSDPNVSIGYSEAESSFMSKHWHPTRQRMHSGLHAQDLKAKDETGSYHDIAADKDSELKSRRNADCESSQNKNVPWMSQVDCRQRLPRSLGSMMSDISSNMATSDPCSTRHYFLARPGSLESRTLFSHTPTGRNC